MILVLSPTLQIIQEQFYLGDEITNLDRIAALKEECSHKKDGHKTAQIGFGS